MKSVINFLVVFFLTVTSSFSFDRTVLAEIFTSTTCGPCASQNPYFDSWLKNYSNKNRVAVIKYHVWWPSPGNDPFYWANTTENSVRTNYYFPGSKYVPHGMINGTADGQSSAGTWIVLVQNSILSQSQFDIKILGNVDETSGGNLTIKVTADNNPIPSGDLRLHVAVVESNINYTGPNSDPIHNYVMRKMYPDHNGESFTINPNETKTFTRVFNWNSSWNLSNSEIVAFIQNNDTKEVYQAAIRRANIYLAAPTQNFPPNNNRNQPISITLKWNRNSQAINYGLEVATDSLFTNKIFSDTTLTDTFKILLKLQKETWYYWRVKAISSYSSSDWSSAWKFKTLPNSAPQQVQLIYPSPDSLLLNPQTILFKWFQSFPDVEEYRIQVADDSMFNSILADTTTIDTTIYLSWFGWYGIEDNYWRVIARNGMGWGVPSDTRKFMILLTNVDDESYPEDFVLYQNYPNPFNSSTKIRFTIPSSSSDVNNTVPVKLKIYDLFGREIQTMVDDKFSSGSYEVEFSIDKKKNNLISSGVYIYQLKAGNVSLSRKMIYLK